MGRELLRRAFMVLFLRPFLRFFMGVRVEGAENLPAADPFLLIANHNSHLDTPLLLSLFPVKRLSRIHPVAAADYWMSSPARRFVAETFFNVLPIERRGASRTGRDPLLGLAEALRRGESLLLFPEGTRGEPEVLSRFHSGAARLLAEQPRVPVVPVFLKNAGRSLPRGTALLVPFICEVKVGKPFLPVGEVAEIQERLEGAVQELA
jgi:1-acyl-sn-glycerol-3-phosphate acyltransferase